LSKRAGLRSLQTHGCQKKTVRGRDETQQMETVVQCSRWDAERNFRKEKRSNEIHRSTTNPEARLYKKGDGQLAKLCYFGHALMENRHGLVVGGGASLPNRHGRTRRGTGAGRWPSRQATH